MSPATDQTRSLFENAPEPGASQEVLASGAVLLRGFATGREADLMTALAGVLAEAPFRHMVVAGGFRMSVGMTNCGRAGWVSDLHGYRYDAIDPASGNPWPAMPEPFQSLAVTAAHAAGFPHFETDACLINRYDPGAKMGLHQDKNEQDYDAPIVSVSLGLPATFLFGGKTRKETPRRIRLESGDVVVWGGPARLAYHGVAPLKAGIHPLTGECRINLTFRKAS